MSYLVIVESPAKANTIKGYLGSNYKVVASKGHIRDLPKSSLGVDVKKGFELAKDYVDSHPDMKAPLIVVNSWNEWTEGSYLHPDDLYGYGYLETIKKVFLEQ